jgi:hypothetical protein
VKGEEADDAGECRRGRSHDHLQTVMPCRNALVRCRIAKPSQMSCTSLATLQSESTHHIITHHKHCMKNGSIHYRNENNDRLASNLHFSNFPTRHARSRAETTG